MCVYNVSGRGQWPRSGDEIRLEEFTFEITKTLGNNEVTYVGHCGLDSKASTMLTALNEQ